MVAILQMNQTTYTRYEQGVKDIPVESAKRMANFYHVSIDYIAGPIDTPHTIDGKPYTLHRFRR